MVPVKVLTLIASAAPAPSIVILKPVEKQPREGHARIVPIWVGATEALNLGVALEKTRFERPTTHDLFLDALASLDATIDHVLINKVEGKTFFSRMTLSQHGRLVDVDARPSDSIALAVRLESPLFIDEDVLDRASYPYIYKTPFDEEQTIKEFHDFLEDISPDDFKD